MLIRYLSDVHLEYRKPSDGFLDLPSLNTDRDSVLILAGDIGSGTGVIDWFKVLSPRFRHIIYVSGNHDYWEYEKRKLDEQWFDLCNELSNVTYLNNSSLVIDDVEFIGATLWADFDGQDDKTMNHSLEIIPDFRKIKIGTDFITPQDMIAEHHKSREFIFSAIKSSEQPKHVVITHYLPSFRSIDPRFAESPLNGYFATDLDKEILDAEPQVWIHGHTHASCNYEIGKTRVLCNPYGYQHIELNKQYSENTLLEL